MLSLLLILSSQAGTAVTVPLCAEPVVCEERWGLPGSEFILTGVSPVVPRVEFIDVSEDCQSWIMRVFPQTGGACVSVTETKAPRVIADCEELELNMKTWLSLCRSEVTISPQPLPSVDVFIEQFIAEVLEASGSRGWGSFAADLALRGTHTAAPGGSVSLGMTFDRLEVGLLGQYQPAALIDLPSTPGLSCQETISALLLRPTGARVITLGVLGGVDLRRFSPEDVQVRQGDYLGAVAVQPMGGVLLSADYPDRSPLSVLNEVWITSIIGETNLYQGTSVLNEQLSPWRFGASIGIRIDSGED